MNFHGEYFNIYMDFMITGIAAGFTIGFISWAIGFAVNGIIKLFRMAR